MSGFRVGLDRRRRGHPMSDLHAPVEETLDASEGYWTRLVVWDDVTRRQRSRDLRRCCLALLAGAIACCFAAEGALAADGSGARTLAERSAAAGCRRWRHQVRRAARRELGREAQPDWLLAQLSAESNCSPRAESPAGAAGLAQFTTVGAAHAQELLPELGEARPHSPRWAIRAQSAYMAWLLAWARTSLGVEGACASLRLATAAYNAGATHIRREHRAAVAAGTEGTWPDVAAHCQRAAGACAETRAYMARIERRRSWFSWLARIVRPACS